MHGLVALAQADHHGLRLDTVDVRCEGNLLDVGRGVGIRVVLGDIVVGVAQFVAVLPDRFLDVAGQSVPEMPAVSNLLGLGCSHTCAFGIRPGTITTNRGDARVGAKPRGEARRGAIREQIDRPVGGHVQQDGSIRVAAFEREIIDTQHGDCSDRRVRNGADQTQQRIPAGDHTEALAQAGADASGHGETDRFQHCPQSRTAPRIRAGQALDLLDERCGLHDGLSQKNLRTCRHNTTGKPATGTSATRRW